jgi:hypothetical protein
MFMVLLSVDCKTFSVQCAVHNPTQTQLSNLLKAHLGQRSVNVSAILVHVRLARGRGAAVHQLQNFGLLFYPNEARVAIGLQVCAESILHDHALKAGQRFNLPLYGHRAKGLL